MAEFLNIHVVDFFPVSPEKLFNIWTDQILIRKWFTYTDQMAPIKADIDLRVGGRYHLEIIDHDNKRHPITGSFKQVSKPNKLVYSWLWESDILATGETEVSVDFVYQGNSCQMKLKHLYFTNENSFLFHKDHWNRAITSLKTYLQNPT